ncbi:uncharacterized protein LOC100207128 isoform X3 [Hydra vulgaris]|uniref:Uncharacterized protein LOC100207128 isoform X3 n=1 Tax=Hydra vulgaris TaxID=6087 RepID=A0ABM4C7E7_HYDVU
MSQDFCMDYSNGPHNPVGTNTNWGTALLEKGSKRKRIDFNECVNKKSNKPKKNFLNFTSEDGIYHAENTNLSPHNFNHRQEDTIYLPLKSCVFINLTSYDEISIHSGNFFFGDDRGVYVSTSAGVALNFMRHSTKEKKLYTARSFIFTDPLKAQEIYERLLST